jgi:hypothetical protein
MAAVRAKRLLHLEKGTFVQADIDDLEKGLWGNVR